MPANPDDKRKVHFATVHWQDDRWIDVQLGYLKKNVGREFRVYAYLNGISDVHCSKFHYASTDPITLHETKLNLLSQVIAEQADPEDFLVFIDGDAFPIADLSPIFERSMKDFPLTAVQRVENNGDKQPHPCFCVTTVGFWKRIKGDWNRGYSWPDFRGLQVTDVGGNLLGLLQAGNIAWLPMLRSNRVNPHPVFYGVYENLVYHHGAGFRPPFERIDTESRVGTIFRLLRFIGDLIPRALREAIKAPFAWLLESYRGVLAKGNVSLSQEIFDRIRTNPEFYREFQGVELPPGSSPGSGRAGT